MNHILLNVVVGVMFGAGAVFLKMPLGKAKKHVPFLTYVLFFAVGFGLGMLVLPTMFASKSLLLAMLSKNPLLFSTKAFKLIVGVGTAGAFIAGFKIGKWEA